MTTTAPARRPARPAPPKAFVTDPNSVRRTLLALLASGLGIVPLKGLFSDNGWLIDVWLTMIVVIGPAALLRRRRAPGALDIWPGIVLMIPWLTLRFLRPHAIAGVIPGPAAWHDVSQLLVNLHKTTRDDVAPIHTTVAVRLVICALLGLVAALVDLVAVVGRRGALAGVPLLVVYTVAGAVPRHPVSWVWFAFAAAGFLVLLGLDSEDVLASWGRRIRPPKASRGANSVSVTTPRIAVVAVVVAIALPLLVPAQSRNLISNAFHNGHSGGGSGVGSFGGGSAGSIAPFAELKGQLNRKTPINLFRVQMLGSDTTQPFYLRLNVLDQYTGNGFVVSNHGETTTIGSGGRPVDSGAAGVPFATEPGGTGTAVELHARISLSDQVRGNAPVFAVPTSVTGLSDDATWDAQDQILLGQQITTATQYTETFDQPEPTPAQLAATGNTVDQQQLARYLDLPTLPSYVTRLVHRLVRGKQSLYARALAINNYFTNPDNGFGYSLETKVGDSGNALEDFLKNKQGYCQQYAAAEAVMLRAVGVPSRVVLGYMHTATGKNKSFTVTTTDAHAWDEAYFPGQGWIPFDPTPSAGLAGNSKTDLPWARHKDEPVGKGGASAAPTVSRGSSSANTAGPSTSAPSSAAPLAGGGGGASPTSLTPLWWTLAGLVVVALLLAPAAARGWRRRSRVAAARRLGDAGALWAELSDTVVDLGYPWSSARTPRQVVRWLSRDTPASSTWFSTLADAVERQRYSRPGPAGAATTAAADAAADLASGARSALGELGSGRTRSTRLRAALWPASLGWGRFTPGGWLARRRA
ncbi:DUF3488 and transglutaminase-like domain-containing protein [Jatrophihabitans endophyticus]|uniref:transglutaminase TgpA family protein n=1 Tax=Jatrophihabitans endophyticus TaxID=1206085 RepID=UPI0019D88FF0|nr:DUF3488 and transglutaminase-like domain-containing protein [Jatrophihabitans endophyticus]MBE7187379.1 transglutaminase domain-containing protein [Jatrophihabitans endophyticus]